MSALLDQLFADIARDQIGALCPTNDHVQATEPPDDEPETIEEKPEEAGP